jgi:hypothetical protein
MKFIRIAGLCLVAIFAMGAVAANSASAALVWEHCETEKENTTVSKWTTDQCRTAASMAAAGFSWQEVKGTEKVVTHGSLLLTDTKVPIEGSVSVQCTGKDSGTVGPGKHDRIEEITEIQCAAGEHCEKLEGEVKPLNLPWQTELVETEGGRDTLKAVNGKGAGWSVTCKVLGITKTDECTTEEGSTSVANVLTPGVPGELLVLADFEAKSALANCTVGGSKSGEVQGTIATLQASGQALRIS